MATEMTQPDWTHDTVLSILRRDNPKAPEQSLRLYADAFLRYRSAAANVDQFGAVCAHPRTGQPMENPYLRIQHAAAKALESIKIRLRTDALWQDGPKKST